MYSNMLILSILAFLCSVTWAKEMPVDEVRAAELYDSGIVHESIMAAKHQAWAKAEAEGKMDSTQYPELGYTKCVDGVAAAIPGNVNNTFRCSNADLYHFLSHADLGSAGRGSSSWGWTSEDGREFIALGQEDGTGFAEISKEGKLVYLGRLPHSSVPSIWREIRAYENYMVVGSEAVGHGVQVFDMRKLLTLSAASPKTFDSIADLAGYFNKLPVGRTHNVVVNQELKYAVAVGAQPRNASCLSGLIFMDLTDLSNITTPGCSDADGYVHDAQCLVYRGPDTKYYGKDICYGYNEDSLTIYDVTDKAKASVISRTSYEGASYTHQGWVLDPLNQEYLLLDDELDEQAHAGPASDGFPVTYIWDIKSLAAPKQTGYFKSNIRGIDHNQYVIGGLTYQSNYGNGLRVADVSSIPRDPTGKSVCDVANFDTYPEDDAAPGGGREEFVSSWSSYGYFKSGFVVVNTIERGVFVVKLTRKTCG